LGPPLLATNPVVSFAEAVSKSRLKGSAMAGSAERCRSLRNEQVLWRNGPQPQEKAGAATRSRPGWLGSDKGKDQPAIRLYANPWLEPLTASRPREAVSRFSKKSDDPGPSVHTQEKCAGQGRPPDRPSLLGSQGGKDCLPLDRLVVDATASIYRQIYSRCPLARRPAAHGQQVLVRRRWELTGRVWRDDESRQCNGPAVAPTEEKNGKVEETALL
jgi:hypothetical protein